MKQHEAVRIALQELGGYATFSQLNRAALRVQNVDWSGTKTPFASIRRIVQSYPNLFFKLRPGLWGLTAQRDDIMQRLQIDAPSLPLKTEAANAFDHGYYQGLLVELGNLTHQTCVPAQDRNRRFLQTPLHTLTTLAATPPFTFENVLRFAKTVDVAWYNERLLPDAFFEVEHSTNIQDSLVKFSELQNFYVRFHIVADTARRPEYDDKMGRAAFAPLRGRVTFLSYEALAKKHERALELASLS